ncbi:MAG: LacI family DNA-binding transcriptional regulator [Balneolaceae bacterium]|nr:LacI family DNA-binding transcriptional regulator [Balneolaceae bacterium]
MKKNVRLIDIAEKLDLTKVSVSKALRDHPDISESTRKKVKKVAGEMGYRPNLVARSLTSQKSQTIGVIIPKMAHYFFAPVIEGIYKSANSSDYEVVLGISLEDKMLERKHLESMLNMRVDGLLVSITEQTRDSERFNIVREMGIDLVFFDRGFADAGFTYVKVNDRLSSKEGVMHLIENGFTDIAHLAGYQSVEIGRGRKLGYMDALKEASIKPDENAIVEGGYSEKDGYRSFKKLLKQYGKPEALFAVTYPVGLGALECMNDHDINPKDVTILAFGGSEFNKHLVNPFICIEQPTYELGKRAFRQIEKELNSENQIKPEIIELSATLGEQKTF